jgi:GAF domain-containing protein
MAESNFEILLDMILAEARRYCNADGGTLYLLRDESVLEFRITVNQSMGIAYRVGEADAPPFAPIPLNRPEVEGPKHIASHVAITGETVNLADVYTESGFDCSGVHAFDHNSGYRTRSMLTIALRDKEGRVIGVLQLVNAMDEHGSAPVPFDQTDQAFIERLSLLAGQALDSYRKVARLRRQANALILNIDHKEKAKQVEAIAGTEYFRRLRAKAAALRNTTQPLETAGTS